MTYYSGGRRGRLEVRVLGILVLPILLAASGCATEGLTLTARTWRLPSAASGYPEFNIRPRPASLRHWESRHRARTTFGIVFSGGGTRSASASAGQFRALYELGWIEQANYISAVSGGAWAALPYTYLPEGQTDAAFLGEYVSPDNLTEAQLKIGSMNGTLETAIEDAGVFLRMLRAWVTLRGDESFAGILNDVFLEDFQLNDRRRFFTWADSDARRLVDANPDLGAPGKPCETTFYCVDGRKSRPYLIVGATLQKPHPITHLVRRPEDIYPFEITPLYSGVPVPIRSLCRQAVAIGLGRAHYCRDGDRIGGGFMESFVYDADILGPNAADGSAIDVTVPSVRRRFTLSDVIAASGAAPQEAATGELKYGLLGIPSNLGFPEFEHWPLAPPSPEQQKEYAHGDGGNIDNIGLLPLLARGVQNILVFVNTQTPFDMEKADKYEAGSKKFEKFLYKDLVEYFCPNLEWSRDGCRNRVFGSHDFSDLVAHFVELKIARKPLVYCKKDGYDVQVNAFWNIPGGWKANVCWVYLDRTGRWVDQIKANKKLGEEGSKINEQRPPYGNLPHTRTFLQQWHDLQVIDRSREHVIATANLTAWTVCYTSRLIAARLSLKTSRPESACASTDK